MATTASPCVRSDTIPRCTTEREWHVSDMAVRGNKLAVCGYHVRTDDTPSFIDLFTLNDPGSSSPMLMTQLFTKLFDHPRWLPFRYVSFLDDSRIVTVHGDLVQVYHIEADDSEPSHTVNLLHDREASCVTVRERAIFIGLSRSNEVIVFDFSLNKIKTITLEGLEGDDYPADITVYEDNLFISTGHRRAIRYNMEGKIVHEYKAPGCLDAESITVSGLVYILWDWLLVVVYSLSDSQQLMSFNVDLPNRIRIVDVNRLLTVYRTGEVREYSMTQLCTFENLKRTLCRVLSPIDCAELKRFFEITDLDMSTNGNESRDIETGTQDDRAAHLLAILETKGFIGSDNLDGLKKAFQHLGTAHVSMLRSQLESFQLHSKPSVEHSDSQSTPGQDSHIWKSLDRFSTRGKWKVDDLAVVVSGKIVVSGHGIQDRGIFLDKISPVTVREDTGLLTIECSAEFSYEGNTDNKNCDDDGNNGDEDSSDNSSVDSMSDYSDRNHFTSIIDESRIVSCQGKTLKILSLKNKTEVPSITFDGIASCVAVRGSDILVGYKSYSPGPPFPFIDVFDSFLLKKKCPIKLKDLQRDVSVIDLSLLARKLLVLIHEIGTLESDVCLFDGDGNKLLSYSPPLDEEWVARSVAVNDTYQMVAILWSDRKDEDEDEDEDEDGTYLSFHLVDSGLCLCLAEVNQACKLRFMNSEELVLVSNKGQISSYKKTYFFSYNNLIDPILESLASEEGCNILWQFFAVSADERTKVIEDHDYDDYDPKKLAKGFMAFLHKKIVSSSQRVAALLKASWELERYHAFALSARIDYYKCLSSGSGNYNDQPYQLLHYYESSVPLGETAATQRQIQTVDDVPGTSNSSPSVSVPSQSEIRRTDPSTYYPASPNNSAPKRRAPPYSGTNVEPHNKRKLNYPSLKGTLTELFSKNDCHQLARHVALPTNQLDAIINSDSSSKDLLDILEERGVIHTSNVSRLLEAISVLKINEKALLMLERYQRSRGDETSYGRFLAGLSSHLLLSLPRKLCDYFEFTNEKKKAVITSQTPGISFLLTLEDMGVINPFDVGKLVTPLKQYQLVQAVAKVQEYQTLVDERSEFKKPIHTLEGKQTLFIECLRKKTKSWYETMTPLPWKKSCKWMTSELFIACGLVLTDSKSKMKTTDVDQECKLKYTDILTHRRLKSATRIIIEGDPGSGKTMLSSQLAYDWSIGKSSDARMVVFLPLKFVDGITIIEAIKQFYIPKGKPLNEGDIKAILDQASDENKTCIVLDGLEEYNGRTKDGEPSEVDRVMRKEKFPNCTVVLTSRSDFVHDLPQVPMLKLGRFGEEERDQYIANIIPDDREKQQKVKCSIETSALLFDLCSNPLLFVYIVHNIEHLGQIDNPKGQLDSVGPFMEVMVNTLLSLSRSEGSESEIMSTRLSEIAFNGLCKGYQQLMWQKSFLNENVSNIKDWIESGILVVEEGVMAREEEHQNKREAVEEGMVTQDDIISIEDERQWGESSSEAAMIRKGQDDVLSIDEENRSDRGSSIDSKLNEKEKPFTAMKTSTDPQNLSVQVKSLHKVIRKRFTDNDRRQGESSSKAAMIGEGQDDILSIDEERPSDRGSSTDNKTKETEKPFTKRKTTTDLQNLSQQVKFLHKVIQEWFAAKHFSSMLLRSKGKNRHRLFLNRQLPLINPADLHYVFRFTSYLCPENCYLIMEHLHSCYKSSNGVVPEYILNCIFLCFIECNSSVQNKRMDKAVRQVCKNIVTIRGGDSRILQQSKVSMLMYASNSKIRIGTLRLVDLVVEVTKATLTFNSNITLECFPTLKVIEVSRWDMRLKEEDFEELIKFITQCKLLNKAFLSFPSPPPLLTDKKVLSSMKKNLTIEWIIGDRIVHTLDKKSGEWPMQFRSTPHQITDFSQPGPSKSSAHSGKKMKQQIVQTPQITKAFQILTQGETYQVLSKSLRVMLMINKEGGRLEIPDTGVSLEIPSGALEGEQFIQMKVIPDHLESESLTFASNSSLVVELLPSNLNLLKPAILTLPHCLVLKKGCEWKAKIYRSHHKEGSEPQWEEQSNTHYKLGEHVCVIEIQRFSWEKFVILDKIVEAKNIVVYAVGRCGPTNSMYLDIGYYWDLATFEEVFQRSNAKLLHKKPTVFYNDGKHLEISLQKFTPMNWTCSKKKKQTISFDEVAIAPWSFCTFVLDKTEPKGTDACTCYCKVGQARNLQDFIFQLKAPDPSSVKQPSTSASDRVVTTAAIQNLSKKLCDEWRNVGRKLGIEEPQLQAINTDNSKAQEKVLQMLVTWEQSKGNEATYRLLGEALQSAGRKDLQDYLYQQACDHYYEQRYGDNSQEGRRSIEEPIHRDERQSEVERTPKELHVGSDGLSTSSDSGDQPIKIKHRQSKNSLTTETERASAGGGTGLSTITMKSRERATFGRGRENTKIVLIIVLILSIAFAIGCKIIL